MFVPPYSRILKALGLDHARVRDTGQVVISKDFFHFLLTSLLKTGEFNEQAYLDAHPDVAQAVKAGTLKSGRDHYMAVGYFEGRTTGTVRLDETWYLTSNPDVADGVRRNAPKSAQEHYLSIGTAEGRAPNAAAVHDLREWNQALHVAANRGQPTALNTVTGTPSPTRTIETPEQKFNPPSGIGVVGSVFKRFTGS